MNSAVITKIEYMYPDGTEYTEIENIPESGNLKADQLEGPGGIYTDIKVNFNIAETCQTTDEALAVLTRRKAMFRCTDANDNVHLVGTTTYPARFSASKEVNEKPGGFNGYRCQITCKQPGYMQTIAEGVLYEPGGSS